MTASWRQGRNGSSRFDKVGLCSCAGVGLWVWERREEQEERGRDLVLATIRPDAASRLFDGTLSERLGRDVEAQRPAVNQQIKAETRVTLVWQVEYRTTCRARGTRRRETTTMNAPKDSKQ